MEWDIYIDKPGLYKVSVDQAFAPGLEGASYKVISNKKELLVYPSVTKHGRDFMPIEIEILILKRKILISSN